MLLFALPICVAWHLSIKRGMGAFGVVEDHPVLDNAAGLEEIDDGFKVDGQLSDFPGPLHPLRRPQNPLALPLSGTTCSC